MGTEVLYPQNCLIGRLGSVPSPSFSPLRKPYHGKTIPNFNANNIYPNYRPNQRARPQRFRHENRGLAPQKVPNPTVETRAGRGQLMVPSQIRLTGPKQYAVDVYAGSGFWLSPSPRALPLPSFSRKMEDEMAIGHVDYSATKDLRRLLRLD